MKIGFFGFAMWVAFCASLFAGEKPNVLFVITDDQAFETVGAYGLTDIETPNIDRLVEEGTSFTRAYNMGAWNGAVCAASRAMLNTGMFVWKAQKISENLNQKERKHEDLPDLQAEKMMWSQLMGAAGYDTYMTGKWHVKASAEDIFDTVASKRGGMPNQTPQGYNRPIEGKEDEWSPSDMKVGGFWKGGKHWSEVVADEAVNFLKTAETQENPFFMYIAFNAPHDPRQAPKEYIDRYPLDRMQMPVNFLPEYPYNEEIGNHRGLRDEKLAPFPRTEHAVKVHRQEYYAIITHLDDQLGRILDQLEASGKKGNTYIVFTSDHGLAVGQHGLMGKQTLYEHSTKVPFIVTGPEVEAGAENHSPIYLQDAMPTALEWAGAKIPDHVQFQSVIPMLRGESGGYPSIYGGYVNWQRSITVGDLKLVLYPEIRKVLMFNIQADPYEMTDIAPKNLDRAKELFQQLLKLQIETGDSLDLKALYPDLSGG